MACPYLGIRDDSTIMLSEPSQMHRCFAETAQRPPALEYQARFCLSAAYEECPVYRIAGLKPAQMRATVSVPVNRPQRGRVPLILTVLLVLGGLTLAGFYVSGQFTLPGSTLFGATTMAQPTDAIQESIAELTPASLAQSQAIATPSPDSDESLMALSSDVGMAQSVTATVTATQSAALSDTANSGALIEEVGELPATQSPSEMPFVLPTVTPNPAEIAESAMEASAQQTREILLSPIASQVGWLDSSTSIAAWGDSFLYAGAIDNASLISGMRFDLSRVGRGAPVYGGTLQLTGLVDDRLDATQGGIWRVQIIAQNELASLAEANFMMLYSAPATITTLRDLSAADLGRGKANTWELGRFELEWLAKQLVDGATSIIVRVVYVPDGPGNTIFAWDSGVGDRSNGNAPILKLTVGPVPATPPPLPTRNYLVATFTPVPQNVLTLVAQQATETMVATTIGTNTPVPPFITPTPPAANLATLQSRAFLQDLPAIAVITPTPASPAEATENAEYATAVAVTTGTYTPVPENFVTPFVIPPSPPAENMQTQVARIAEATAAAQLGRETPTPAPHNMLVGEWMPATPTAENVATAAALAVESTRMVEIYGRPTATPFHWLVYTATPTPIATSTPTIPPIILASDFTPTPIPTATEFIPASLPGEYKGLIFFKRGVDSPQTWFYNPANGETGIVTREWIYPMARRSITLSPNGLEEVIVKDNNEGIAEVFIRATDGSYERKLSNFTAPSYDATWSPDGAWIAFVSSHTGNDEIYRITPDGSVIEQLTFNNWEWDKHPTWSADSSQIVFFSNRDVGHRQIWVMNADGSGQRRLVESEAEDMYPVWAQ